MYIEILATWKNPRVNPLANIISTGIWLIRMRVIIAFSSVQFSQSVVSNSLRPHESQHARPPCPSPTPGVHSNSHPVSWWCHPAISSSVVPFPPAPNPSQNESTLCMRWPKYWSFSFSIIPSKEHPGLISFEMQIRMKWGIIPHRSDI